MRILTAILLFISIAQAKVTDREIANMFMLGFEGKSLSASSSIVRDVCERGLGGVILFKKNIGTASQLRALTHQLSSCRHKPLIATDQEGGKVRRIRYGYDYPRASQVARGGTAYAKKLYNKMGAELHRLGINFNLGPVADLDIEPKNYIIHKLGRSYGSDPRTVHSFNSVFIGAMHRNHVLTSLKHYPGHGSSLGDTHRRFVDVSKTWSPKELEPFKNPMADSVMVAHVVNSQITEPGRPASLSSRAIRKLRRSSHSVVVITDDLQMGAIRKYYTTLQTLRMAINAGDDILLFGNQLTKKHKVNTRQLIGMVRQLLGEKKISEASIKNANHRINRMRKKIGLPEVHSVSKHHSRTTKKPRKSVKDLY